MKERAANFLLEQAAPVAASLLAREILGLRGGPESAYDALLVPILGADPRFERLRGGAWRLGESASPWASAPALSESGLAVWAAEPGLCAAAVVRLEGGRIVAERYEGPQAGCGPLSTSAIRRLARIAENTSWASIEPAALLRELGRRLSGTRAAPRSVEWIHLYRLAAVVFDGPRPRDLAALAARLGAGPASFEHPLERARSAAECLLRLLEHPRLALASSPTELADLVRAHPDPPDLSGRAFDAIDIAAIPDAPGIYRFFDSRGCLLYVGKARNLRGRVGSYFAARRRPDPRTSPWLPRVHRFEIEESGSELEALLREAEAIARTGPIHNVQRVVHERRHGKSADLVLLLPSPGRKNVTAHLVKDGALAGHVRLGPGRRGHVRLGRLIESVFFVQESDLGGNALRARMAPGSSRFEAPSRGSAPSGSSRSDRSPASSSGTAPGSSRGAASSQGVAPSGSARSKRTIAHQPSIAVVARRSSRSLISSWLSRQQGPVPAFDPTDAAGPREALGIALRYAHSVAQGERDAIHR